MLLSTQIRRHIPHAVFVTLLVLALLAGALGIRRALAPAAARSDRTPAQVIHWGNEGTGDIYTLDPALGPDLNGSIVAQLIFGGLVRFGPGFEILPDVADRWEASVDGRTYTFHLRAAARFADGRPLTATDVAYSLGRVLSPTFAEQSGASLLGDIEGADAALAGRRPTVSGIQVLDAHTIRIRLSQASGSFLARLATQAGYIVPSWRVQADPSHWDHRAIGTGPFMITRWVPGQSIQLAPNPYYYGGHLRIAAIDMPLIPEPLDAFKLYRSGALDIMGTVQFPTEALYDIQGAPDFYRSARLETVYLSLNTLAEPFRDPRVRQALAAAIDKDALVRDVFAGFAHRADGMVPRGMVGYDPGLQGIGYDPVRARALLAQAGYPGGSGMPAITYLVDQDAQSLVLANELARQWQHVLGIRIQLLRRDHTAYNLQLSRRDYQIAVIDWTADYPDPQNFLSQLLHSGYPNNNGDWHNATFDRLVDEADHMPADTPGRLQRYHEAESIAMEQAAAIPLVNPTGGILLRSTIRGMKVEGGQIMVADWTKVSISSGGNT